MIIHRNHDNTYGNDKKLTSLNVPGGATCFILHIVYTLLTADHFLKI